MWGRLEADHSGVTVWQVVDRGGWWGLNGFGYRRPYFQEGGLWHRYRGPYCLGGGLVLVLACRSEHQMSLSWKPMSWGTVSCWTISMASWTLLDPSGKPVFDVGDEMYRVPLDSVVGGVGVFDNGRFSKPPPRALGSSLPEAPPLSRHCLPPIPRPRLSPTPAHSTLSQHAGVPLSP